MHLGPLNLKHLPSLPLPSPADWGLLQQSPGPTPLVLPALLLTAWATSRLLLEFPWLLHRRSEKLLDRPLQRIAHRGSRAEGLPENSLAAFRDAIEAGAQVVELDVWQTASGEVVVFHDSTLARMAAGGSSAEISRLDYAALPPLRQDIQGQCERIPGVSREECLRIPRLEEVLALLPEDVSVVVEFKQLSERLIEEVLRIVAASGKMDRVLWFSLDERVNARLRSRPAASQIPVITSVQGMLRVFLHYYLGLVPFLPFGCDVFGITVEEVNLEVVRREPALRGLPDWLKRVIAFFFGGKPSRAMLCPALFRHLRRRGVGVWFLGVNSEEDLRVAERTGATGVLTDRIRWLTNTIAEKGIVFSQIGV